MGHFTITISAKDNGTPQVKSFDFYTNCHIKEESFVEDFKVFNPTLTDVSVLSYVEAISALTAEPSFINA